MGEHDLKNVAEPIQVYRITADPSDTGAASPAQKPLALPDKPSIAVLPFTNMSGDPEQDYFSDGITFEITTQLARFRDLFVISQEIEPYRVMKARLTVGPEGTGDGGLLSDPLEPVSGTPWTEDRLLGWLVGLLP